MKWILFVALAVLPSCGFAQDKSLLTDDNWDTLITNLNKENWAAANKSASLFLGKFTKDSVNCKDAAILRYMFILSESGLLNEGKTNKKKALNTVRKFAGLKICLAGHPLSLDGEFNYIRPVNYTIDTLMVCASNKQATQIFSFEYIALEKKISLDEFKKDIGSTGLIEGVLSDISAEGEALPRFRIHINNASMEVVAADK